MASPRKKWQLRYRTTSAVDTFPSQRKTYDFIQSLASAYRTKNGRMDPLVHVWCTDGTDRNGNPRWVPYEDINLAELATPQEGQ
jgi:hypothetical protein